MVFTAPLALTVVDFDHAHSKQRYVDIGMSANNRLLVIVYTVKLSLSNLC